MLLTLWDMWRNAYNTYLEKREPYRILLLATNDGLMHSVHDVLKTYEIYETTSLFLDGDRQVALDTYDIVIIAGSVSSDVLQHYADQAKINGQLFYYVSEHHLVEDIIPLPTRLGPLLALEYIASPLDGWWRVIKRVFDLVVSSMALLVLSPLFLLLAICIKLDSRGPVFYTQQRLGK